ncbi:MAG: FtsX-like permease family protein [Bacteroidota bacterium]
MFRNYLKIAWKVLGRNKFFTIVSLFGISFTIGILLVLSTFFDNMFNANYPEGNRDRSLYIVELELTDGKDDYWMGTPSALFINNYVKQLKTPQVVGLISRPFENNSNAFVSGKKLSLAVRRTCNNFWKISTFDFLEGSPYQKQQIDNSERVAVITQSTKSAYFGDTDSVIGQMIEIEGGRYKVMGVVRDVSSTQVFTYADVYLPYTGTDIGNVSKDIIGEYIGILMGSSAADVPKIREEYQAMINRMEIPVPSDPYFEKFKTINSDTETLLEFIATKQFFQFADKSEAVRNLFTMLIGAMILFMLLPALNLVNLNASRISERSSEIGIRKAFGATVPNLMIQFLVENILLTLIGGLLGLLLAIGILQIIKASELFAPFNFTINYRVFLIALVLSVFFGILSGVLPARRMAKFQIVNALKGKQL